MKAKKSWCLFMNILCQVDQCALVCSAEMTFLALKTWERILKQAESPLPKPGTRRGRLKKPAPGSARNDEAGGGLVDGGGFYSKLKAKIFLTRFLLGSIWIRIRIEKGGGA